MPARTASATGAAPGQSGAAAVYVVSPKAAINVQLAYDDFETFSAVANVSYELVPGFVVTPEIAYAKNYDDDIGSAFDDGELVGFIRFRGQILSRLWITRASTGSTFR